MEFLLLILAICTTPFLLGLYFIKGFEKSSPPPNPKHSKQIPIPQKQAKTIGDSWNGLWEKSRNGNATMTRAGYRVTVFQQKHGWTYSITDIEADDIGDVEFYDGHESETEARLAAMDHLLELAET